MPPLLTISLYLSVSPLSLALSFCKLLRVYEFQSTYIVTNICVMSSNIKVHFASVYFTVVFNTLNQTYRLGMSNKL